MVLRPFVRRHLPRIIPDYGRYRKAGPQGTYDGPSGPNSRSNYKAKVVSATSKGSQSGTGRSWFGRSGLKREESDEDSATIGEDVELGERGGGKVTRTESEEHLAGYPSVPMPGGEGIIKTVDVRVR